MSYTEQLPERQQRRSRSTRLVFPQKTTDVMKLMSVCTMFKGDAARRMVDARYPEMREICLMKERPPVTRDLLLSLDGPKRVWRAPDSSSERFALANKIDRSRSS